ncbi:DMT family transporter [Aquicella lusitana]|uniref:Small multidrug resistance pump n=1 Tax=Aquicella lusitana TaxID=254246 RepID=A0A370H1E8_9COXI|nr:multidrug efflux SMR transporter [Aquicella lusitana]RDI48825.1 small multidrug resistance pump [Aquicella lusitana]VVC73253.1 Quaternary ammonium compound-resistance protein QacC [Aquicella lusitana]
MSNSITWFYLVLAIFTEVAGTTAMKLSNGFARFEPSLLIFFFYALSLLFLTLSLKRLEIGFAYAIWSGLGTFLIFLVSVAFFHEPMTVLKTLSLGCIIIGVTGLKQT